MEKVNSGPFSMKTGQEHKARADTTEQTDSKAGFHQ